MRKHAAEGCTAVAAGMLLLQLQASRLHGCSCSEAERTKCAPGKVVSLHVDKPGLSKRGQAGLVQAWTSWACPSVDKPSLSRCRDSGCRESAAAATGLMASRLEGFKAVAACSSILTRGACQDARAC